MVFAYLFMLTYLDDYASKNDNAWRKYCLCLLSLYLYFKGWHEYITLITGSFTRHTYSSLLDHVNYDWSHSCKRVITIAN
ncbi:hypothetical protein Pse7367_1585 [Thalassoporum mexicanum PCC 7367]|nr:hypothetical protein Pse7367_1585 [Pseudanabaena sp. PCC 7367]